MTELYLELPIPDDDEEFWPEDEDEEWEFRIKDYLAEWRTIHEYI